MIGRVNSLILLVAVAFIFVSPSPAQESGLSRETDLSAIAEQAARNKRPVMVLFAADHCEYCERLENDHLAPMSINAEYQQKIIIRKVMIDSYYTTRDFSGKDLSGDEIADKYGVRVTPTVVILDDKGQALHKKIIGYNGNQYFGWDLDMAIDGARQRYGSPES